MEASKQILVGVASRAVALGLAFITAASVSIGAAAVVTGSGGSAAGAVGQVALAAVNAVLGVAGV